MSLDQHEGVSRSAQPAAGHETINGVAVQLGGMCLDSLLTIEAACQQRAQEARLDCMVVSDYIGRIVGPRGTV